VVRRQDGESGIITVIPIAFHGQIPPSASAMQTHAKPGGLPRCRGIGRRRFDREASHTGRRIDPAAARRASPGVDRLKGDGYIFGNNHHPAAMDDPPGGSRTDPVPAGKLTYRDALIVTIKDGEHHLV